MKFLNQLLILSLFLGVLFTSCSDDDDDMPKTVMQNIVEIAQADAQFSILVDAVVKADLATTLSSDGPFTVFAPTNDAFTALLAANGYSSLDDIPVAALTNILLNHVVSGSVRSTDLSTGYQKSLATGPGGNMLDLYIDLSSGVKINGNATVTAADIEAENGYIHVIDQVIISPTVVTQAVVNPDFSVLVQALSQTALSADYVTILSGTGPFTVFAPTNAAFIDLLNSNPDWNALEDIPIEVLEKVLIYHVVSGANVTSSMLSDEMEVTTLDGMFTIDLDNGAQIRTSSGGISNIIATDVQATNGIVHAIDAVLLPDGLNISNDPNVVEIAQSDAQFSILVDAVVKAGFVSTLSGEGPFTVFAPTNTAFEALLADLGFSSLDDIPLELLQNILLNHVVSGDVRSTDLSTGYVKTLATGPDASNLDIYVDLSNGVVINSANVTAADVVASNGVVHVIDKVITLPTVVNHALNNPDFSILVQALTRSDVTTNYVSILNGDGPFTVFAPTNDAFIALLEGNADWNALDDIPVEILEGVLNYHVVSNANVQASMLTDEMSVPTLNGSFIIDLDNGAQIKTSSGGTSNIIKTDVQGINGIIHAVDAVLVPQF
jgi:transforming growth factor-beta-induced protein